MAFLDWSTEYEISRRHVGLCSGQGGKQSIAEQSKRVGSAMRMACWGAPRFRVGSHHRASSPIIHCISLKHLCLSGFYQGKPILGTVSTLEQHHE